MKKILTLIAALGFATSLVYADAPVVAPAATSSVSTKAPAKHKHKHHKKVKKAAEAPAATTSK